MTKREFEVTYKNKATGELNTIEIMAKDVEHCYAEFEQEYSTDTYHITEIGESFI